MVKKKCFPVFC